MHVLSSIGKGNAKQLSTKEERRERMQCKHCRYLCHYLCHDVRLSWSKPAHAFQVTV